MQCTLKCVGVAIGGGKVFFGVYQTKMLVYDLDSCTLDSIDGASYCKYGASFGGCAYANGKVYCVPRLAGRTELKMAIGLVDPPSKSEPEDNGGKAEASRV